MNKFELPGTFRHSHIKRLFREAIDHLKLELAGARVVTEAATNEYAVTPVIAALAGAEVFALTRDSSYGNVDLVRQHVAAVAEAARVDMASIAILTDRSLVPPSIDLITNLGMVRPIDFELIDRLSPAGVISYMCEAWEFRNGDVDLKACDPLGIPVGGVCEDCNGLNIFRSCGTLAVKMSFEAGLEIAGNRIILISPDRFGPVIESALNANLASVERLDSQASLSRSIVETADAIIVADYTSEQTVLGADEGPSAAQLASWNPGLIIIQFAGSLNVKALAEAGLRVFPERQLQPHSMAFTLSRLGVRPVVFLHAAGLKVGELLWRKRLKQSVSEEFRYLVQPINKAAEVLWNEDSL